MTAIIKEVNKMEAPAKTYLQRYQEFISGYKQYKTEKATPHTKAAKAELV